ncbi:hypothetical protein [Thiobacillus sp.]
MPFLILIALALLPIKALADEFYTLVKYNCDQSGDRIIVTHIGAYDEEGKALISKKDQNSWDPGELRGMQPTDKRFGAPKTIIRTCRLSDGLYTFRLRAMPENFKNITGQCGDWETASVVVLRNDRELVHVQLDQSCYNWKAPVITSIQIHARQEKPILATKSADEFFR